jgi:hypothetical protein
MTNNQLLIRIDELYRKHKNSPTKAIEQELDQLITEWRKRKREELK